MNKKWAKPYSRWDGLWKIMVDLENPLEFPLIATTQRLDMESREEKGHHNGANCKLRRQYKGNGGEKRVMIQGACGKVWGGMVGKWSTSMLAWVREVSLKKDSFTWSDTASNSHNRKQVNWSKKCKKQWKKHQCGCGWNGTTPTGTNVRRQITDVINNCLTSDFRRRHGKTGNELLQKCRALVSTSPRHLLWEGRRLTSAISRG